MNDEKRRLFVSIAIPLSFVLFLWAIKLSELFFHFSLAEYGLYPRRLYGLIGILTGPLIHASITHLLSNSVPLLLIGIGMFYFYPKASYRVAIMVYLIPGIFDWFLARPAYHIGASGLIYGFVTFLFFSGLIRRDTRSIALALIVTFLYGSLIWGILPVDEGVSWETHLFGALTGIFAAFVFKNLDPYKKYEWEDEDNSDDVPPNKLEISYKDPPPWD